MKKLLVLFVLLFSISLTTKASTLEVKPIPIFKQDVTKVQIVLKKKVPKDINQYLINRNNLFRINRKPLRC